MSERSWVEALARKVEDGRLSRYAVCTMYVPRSELGEGIRGVYFGPQAHGVSIIPSDVGHYQYEIKTWPEYFPALEDPRATWVLDYAGNWSYFCRADTIDT